MTAATPMMMPSIVSSVRILFLTMLLPATLMRFDARMTLVWVGATVSAA